jgi:hypothetical protein
MKKESVVLLVMMGLQPQALLEEVRAKVLLAYLKDLHQEEFTKVVKIYKNNKKGLKTLLNQLMHELKAAKEVVLL